MRFDGGMSQAVDIGDVALPCRSSSYRRWFGGLSVAVAWLAIGLALIHPPHGSGLAVCWLKATTGIPCPGCGLTRSLSCVVRGLFSEAWSYHPFGLILAPVLLTIAIVGILPRGMRDRIAAAIARSPMWTDVAYVLLVVSFVGFGLYRALAHLAG